MSTLVSVVAPDSCLSLSETSLVVWAWMAIIWMLLSQER